MKKSKTIVEKRKKSKKLKTKTAGKATQLIMTKEVAMVSTDNGGTILVWYDEAQLIEIIKNGSHNLVLKLTNASIDGVTSGSKISKLFIPYHRVIWWSN